MPTTATLTGQDIGRAERAMRAVLDRLLAKTETTFEQWVMLNVLSMSGTAVERDALMRRVADALKIGEVAALATVDELVDRGLAIGTGDGPLLVDLTPRGKALYKLIRAGVERLTERLYGDLPADDLATVHRVLGVITERANEALAAG